MADRGLRVVCIFFLFVFTLGIHQAVSLATPAATELAADLSADAGQEFAAVLSTEGFSVTGGVAVIDPGTQYEEILEYSSVDAEAGHLTGLVRPAPLAHPAGAYVRAEESGAGEPSSTPSPSGAETGEPEPTDEPSEGQQDAVEGPDCASGLEGTCGDDSTASGTGPADACEISSDACQLVAEPCDSAPSACGIVGDPCASSTALCALVQDPPDPCNPNDNGQTCSEFLAGLLEDLPDLQEAIDRACDPMGTGRTCEEMLEDIPTLDEIVDDACDPDGNGQTCQEMVEDLVTLEGILGELCDADGCVTTLPHPASLLADLANTCYTQGGVMGCVNDWLVLLPTGDCPTVICVPPPTCVRVCPENGESGVEEPVVSEPPPRQGEWVDVGPHACRIIVWSPWKWDTNPSQPGEKAWVYITFKGRAECTPYAPARMHEYGGRSRWHGWQTMVHDDLPVYQTTGDRTVKLDMHCNSWSAGTYNWLSHGIIAIQSNKGTKLIEAVGPETPRYTCKDTASGS